MMKVEMFNQWTANTVSFEGDDDMYLRMASEQSVVWYVTKGGDSFQWVQDRNKLEQAWLGRGMRHGKS